MSEMTCDEYPVRTKQKKPCGEKEGWRFKRNNKIKNILKQICPNFCKFVEKYIFCFILHPSSLCRKDQFAFSWYPLQPGVFFCDKRISCNVYIHSLLLYHIGSFYWPLCMHCLSRYEALGKFRVHSNEVAKRSPISWNSTWEPRKFVGSRGYFDMMELRGPRPCGLLPRLWGSQWG